jgi:Na+-transporting NADH:ubiquinone oxidoreductase subunit B
MSGHSDSRRAVRNTLTRRVLTLGGFYQYQRPMYHVLAAAAPAAAGAVYLFGWRALSVLVLSMALGSATEWLFCRSRGEPVTAAALVTSVLFALTLPPTVPYHVVAVGIVVAIVFGKETFGGFGRNVFNPALVGRCFVYVCFPVAMTARWVTPYEGLPGGLAHWLRAADAVTRATPLLQFRAGQATAPLARLALGNVAGCLGETSALLVLVGGAHLVWERVADWRLPASALAGGLLTSAVFRYVLGATSVADPLFTVLSGGFLFAAVFMVTDPVSAAQTAPGRLVTGLGVGFLTVVIRGFANFSGGVMFAVLLVNTFSPIIDHAVRAVGAATASGRARPQQAAAREGGADP